MTISKDEQNLIRTADINNELYYNIPLKLYTFQKFHPDALARRQLAQLVRYNNYINIG